MLVAICLVQLRQLPCFSHWSILCWPIFTDRSACFSAPWKSPFRYQRSPKASRAVSKKLVNKSIDQWEKTGRLPKLNQTDSHQHSEGRWPQAFARIYLDPQMDSRFQEAYVEAIQNWNQTGAFNFEIVTEPARQISWLRRWMTEVLLWQERQKVRPISWRAILVCNGTVESLLSVQS